MKVQEIIGPQQLDEISLKHAAVAGVIGASMMGTPHKVNTPNAPHIPKPAVTQITAPVVTTSKVSKNQLNPKLQNAIEKIASRYDADPEFIEQVFELAKKYEKPGFPTAKEILAVIAVESEFDPDAVSNLETDPAVGLMQVRPQKWGMSPDQLRDPETAIKIGSAILHKYYKRLHRDKASAIQAYNIGLEKFQRGQENSHYLNKYLVRLGHIPSI